MSSKFFLISLLIVGCGAEDKKRPSDVPAELSATVPAAEPTAEATNSLSTDYPQTLYIDALADLPTCGEENSRQLIYVAEDSSFMACLANEWSVVEINPPAEVPMVLKTPIFELKEPMATPPDQGYAKIASITLTEMNDKRWQLIVIIDGTAIINRAFFFGQIDAPTINFEGFRYTFIFRDWNDKTGIRFGFSASSLDTGINYKAYMLDDQFLIGR